MNENLKNDEEIILEKYLKSLRKRNIIIIFVVFACITIFVCASIFMMQNNAKQFNNVQIYENDVEILNTITNDTINTNIENDNNEQINIQEEPQKNVEEENEKDTKINENKQTVNENKNKQQVNTSKKEKPANKDFLFENGYTMENVTQAATEYLKSKNWPGECVPLKDSEGVYLGMRVIFH